MPIRKNRSVTGNGNGMEYYFAHNKGVFTSWTETKIQY